jgi:hypothetical protein
MSETADVRQVIARLQREARHIEGANSYASDVLAPLIRNAAECLESLTAQPSEVERLQRARIGDSEIIGREMCRAEKAEAEVERLKAELAALDLKWAAASVFVRDVIDACGLPQPPAEGVVDLPALALQVIGQIEEGKLTTQPAPSGWQQRIAAMSPYHRYSGTMMACFCGCWDGNGHEADCLWRLAKVALPPQQSRADIVAEIRALIRAYTDDLDVLAVHNISQAFLNYVDERLKDALPPAPEVKANRFDCPTCGQGIAVDDEACCRACGADATPIVGGTPVWIPEPDAKDAR